ncbi:hypothetical protein [Metarhizobium album]|uniref:hypothetical protein n=1 Tax=Metarhizobium album TaxID=2182425 RepID=UPI000FFE678A|nr:hypothetical protein [Rhizobium album]
MCERQLASVREKRYIEVMSKSVKQVRVTVRDRKTGQVFIVRGAGALKDKELPISKTIDLTKPIASQTLQEKRK